MVRLFFFFWISSSYSNYGLICLGFVLVADMVFVQQSAGRYVLLAMFYELWLLMNYTPLQDSTCDIRDLFEAWMGGSCESGA